MVENRLQRPSAVYVCPVFSSRTCIHARHVILMVLNDCIKLQTACHAHLAIFSFFPFFKKFHFSLKLFLICSYFSGDLSLTVLIKCVLNEEKSVYYFHNLPH